MRASKPVSSGPEERRFGRWAILAMVVVGLIFGARRLLSGGPAAVAAAPERSVAGKVTATATATRAALAAPRAVASAEPASADPLPSPRPSSLRGTSEDGALRVDERGDLIVDPDVLRFFDYYLAATGEESPAAIRARLVAAIRGKLTGPAAERAIGLLDRYLAYREATRTLRGAEDGDLAARLDALRRLRREQFGAADADKLFGLEERADAVAIEKRRVQTDPALSPEQRTRRIAELEEQLPESIRASRAAAARPLRQQEEEQAMRAAGATDEEIQRHRVATVGEAAAGRLKTLDEQRADWTRRLQAFQTDREEIARSQPDSAAREAAVEKLLEASFSPEERLRVKAADAIAAQAGH
jgi:lipase chaperone LimK